MKSEKGITLMSLIIYIMVMLIVIILLNRVLTVFSLNMKELKTDGTFEEDISKINIFLLQDIRNDKCKFSQVSQDNKTVSLIDKNNQIITYLCRNKGLYRNDVLVASNIDCQFSYVDNLLSVYIENSDGTNAKTISYYIS